MKVLKLEDIGTDKTKVANATMVLGKILDDKSQRNVHIVVSALGSVELKKETAKSKKTIDWMMVPHLTFPNMLGLWKAKYIEIKKKNLTLPESLEWIIRDCQGVSRLVQSVMNVLNNQRIASYTDNYRNIYGFIIIDTETLSKGWPRRELREKALVALFNENSTGEEKE